MSHHSYAQKPTITAIALVETSTIIGSVADSNAQFTQQLADRIDSSGIPLSELTIFQLIDLINKQRTEFNNQKTPTKKTSRFTVLNKNNRLRIAQNLTYEQVLQYQDNDNLVIKFSGMMGCSL